jgi:nicotinate-nucleotide pyrophosphorylase (carboxylating)
MSFDPPADDVARTVAAALAEDLGPRGDLTGQLLDESLRATAQFVVRERGVLAGEACALATFAVVDPSLDVEFIRHDGDALEPGDVIATVAGSMRSIVAAERTALNFVCHLSGVATATRVLVEAVSDAPRPVAVLDTRKTIPGLRSLEKAAVRAGGGTNHRSSLSDAILLKDNHLRVIGIKGAVALATARFPGVSVQVECDRFDQVVTALDAGATAILLDNMSPALATECVELVRRHRDEVFVEASGRITATSARDYAMAGVDAISSGALTHSVRSLDIGLDLVEG